MKSVCNYFNRSSVSVLPEYYEDQFLVISLNQYRQWFLKRKNINGYKKCKKGTPEDLDKLFNAFDRKISGLNLFTNQVAIEYFEGLSIIHSHYYGLSNENRPSRRDAYRNFKLTHENVLGELWRPPSFQEFINSGRANKFR